MTELPPEVTVDLAEDLRSYWRDRLRQHTSDVYADVRLSKLPEDLRTYEHLLWADRPDTVIEIGTQYGASALWFRDRLRTLESYGLITEPRVVTVDIDQSQARINLMRADPDYAESIHLIEADVREPGVADEVAGLIGTRCLVVEDSAHEYDSTYAALTAFARFVAPDGYFIVEDGSVDVEALRIADDWPRGVLHALRDWLATEEGRKFELRRDLALYGITSHPSGFLQRRADPISATDRVAEGNGTPAPRSARTCAGRRQDAPGAACGGTASPACGSETPRSPGCVSSWRIPSARGTTTDSGPNSWTPSSDLRAFPTWRCDSASSRAS